MVNYYTQDFHTQMAEAFGDAGFWSDLTTPADGEEDGAASIARILSTNSTLGIDNRSRKCYVLDGSDARYLAGSDQPENVRTPELSRNLSRALNGEIGDDNDPAAAYMDVYNCAAQGAHRRRQPVRSPAHTRGSPSCAARPDSRRHPNAHDDTGRFHRQSGVLWFRAILEWRDP